jgi:2,3-diketo-5-methylthio-1-phosphopentane phosphatase
VRELPFALVTDFDGTVSRHDFFELAVERFVRQDAPAYWREYQAGHLTHFEAMRGIYSHIRCNEETLNQTIRDMRVDPELGSAVDLLRHAGWDVIVVSAGCDWYISRHLAAAGVELTVHTNPSVFDPERGLRMQAPVNSPFFSVTHGVDKKAVVRDAQRRYKRVAFAGNGQPDLAAAIITDPGLRFARGWLARELEERGETFRRFRWWSEIARMLAPGRLSRERHADTGCVE